MPKRKPKAFHLDCADCNKHYCLRSMTEQVWRMAQHHACAIFASIGTTACNDECRDVK